MRPTKRDYYEILSVTRIATADEIKSSSEGRAEMASRPQSRQERDSPKPSSARPPKPIASFPTRRNAPPTTATATPAFPAWAPIPGSTPAIFTEFQDIFGDFFGFEEVFGRSGRAAAVEARAQRGADLRYDMRLSFEEAAAGVTTKIRLPRQEFCEACNGTGAKAGTGVSACETCRGHGQLHYQQGFFSISRTCPAVPGRRPGDAREVSGMPR